VVDRSVSQPEEPIELGPPATPAAAERLHGDLLNAGSGPTTSPTDPPNQGADPDAGGDLLHGGSGETGPG
jgi:hypothetical protein